MLARHLNRLATPVRYAMPGHADPELAAAIRNYLALTLRGANVPHLHQQAQGALQPFYNTHPGQVAQQAFHGMLGEHDPAGLLQYLDLLGEHGGIVGERMADALRLGGANMPGESRQPHLELGWHLANIARPLQGDLLSPQSPVRAFTPGALEHPRPGRLIPAMDRDHIGILMGALGIHSPQSQRLGELTRSAYGTRGSGSADIAQFPPLYDWLHHAAIGHPRLEVKGAAERSRNAIGSLISQHIIPHLYENQP